MVEISQAIAEELDIKRSQVDAALDLFAEGATVPFVARYRKERTGELDEVQLRLIAERHAYLTELESRKQVILSTIAEQGKLTDALQAQILVCRQKTELEDLYLPYRPKRRTRATAAREKGLEPLALWIQGLNQGQQRIDNLELEATRYVSDTTGVKSAQEALQGASDILAEQVAEQATIRAYLREQFLKQGVLTSRIKPDYPEGTTKYEMYRVYQNSLTAIAPHNFLALLRGEREGILKLELEVDEADILAYLTQTQVKTRCPVLRQFYAGMLSDAFQRLIKSSLTSEVMGAKRTWADEASIATFEANLKHLLLSPPAGMQPTLGIDPGFRTGCKVAAIDATGKFLEYQAIFPHQSENQRHQAAATLRTLIQRHQIQLIAIGNGTAGRETDAFVAEVLQTLDHPPIKVMVNEAGASVYSASEVAIAEFPELDITVRGAISIARRLQDPLAELVKIDPKSIGVGQYQHDVDQKRLKQKLDETVESCVNYVGVDLNNASRELLTYVSGITPAIANNIVAYRNQNGAFQSRKDLMQVKKLGAKAFEQSAGFLRIRNGSNPLDNTAVHPESYGIVQTILADLSLPVAEISAAADRLRQVNLRNYITDTIGEPTLRDIWTELEKPGRDPREQFTYASFQEGINDIRDLKVGMEMEGVVTNVANFGAFVDIGVHQDGLVHISQLADRFVSNPNDIVHVGQVVKVRVLEVNEALKRISLTMKLGTANAQPASKATQVKTQPKTQAKPHDKPQAKAQDQNRDRKSPPTPTAQDLQARFNRKKP